MQRHAVIRDQWSVMMRVMEYDGLTSAQGQSQSFRDVKHGDSRFTWQSRFDFRCYSTRILLVVVLQGDAAALMLMHASTGGGRHQVQPLCCSREMDLPASTSSFACACLQHPIIIGYAVSALCSPSMLARSCYGTLRIFGRLAGLMQACASWPREAATTKPCTGDAIDRITA